MVIMCGYSIEEYPKQNKIVIGLPQTMETCTSSTGYFGKRRRKLNDSELASIISFVEYLYQKESGNNEEEI